MFDVVEVWCRLLLIQCAILTICVVSSAVNAMIICLLGVFTRDQVVSSSTSAVYVYISLRRVGIWK